MAIKIWQSSSILFLLLCYLPFFAQDTREDFESRTYDLSSIRSTSDGRYVSFQKGYEYNNDTLAVVDVKNPDHIIFQSPNLYPETVRYTKNGSLFMSGSASAQLLKLPHLKPIVWKNIQKAIYLETVHVIAILQKDTVTFYNEEGRMIDKKPFVISVQYKNNRLFLTTKAKNGFELIEWNTSGEILRYKSDTENILVDNCDRSSIIIQKNAIKKQDAEIIFINTENNDLRVLNLFKYHINQLSTINKVSDDGYLIKFVIQSVDPQETGVDLWYQNDPALENKFRKGKGLKFVLWKPLSDEVLELNNVEYSRYIGINNAKFLIAVRPNLNQDYTKWVSPYQVAKYEVKTGKYVPLGFIGTSATVDQQGRFLLFRFQNKWTLYDIETSERRVLDITTDGKAYFDQQGTHILFEGKNYISEYEIKNNHTKLIKIPTGFDALFTNAKINQIGRDINIIQRYYSAERPLLIKMVNSTTSEQAYGIYDKKRFRLLSKPSQDYLDLGQVLEDGVTFLYVKSNYNNPPTLVINRGYSEKIIYRSNPNDSKSKRLKMERINFTNSQGVPLQGILYYPAEFDRQKKYPMIVGIYELMRSQGNRYLRDGFIGSVEGMNVKYFLEKGYFVFLPDIVYDERGPGRSALDCVESSIAALQKITSINFEKVGLIGHSFGGYETNFIVTQSKHFAAYVSGAGSSDLMRSFHSFNYNYQRPYYWKFEEHQYRMFKPFAEDKNLYMDNSPVYHAEKVESPVLLWAGTADTNVPWDQSMEFYLGLRRNHKKVIALFYKDEGHSFDHKDNRKDLFVRISQWFDYHLKGVKKAWIDQMYK